MSPLFSVIIPLYNCEKYIAECIQSILCQKYNNYEVIIVDDGSTDSSGNIARSFAKNNSKINVISKENGGVASARNSGLKAAIGQYIVFLDSDDIMISNALENISSVLESDGADMYVCGSYYELINNKYIVNRMFDDTVFDTQMDTRTIKILCQNLSSMCIGVYKREFLNENELFVREGITTAEDTDFYFRCLLKCKKIQLIDNALFAYRFNPQSVSNSLSYKNIRDVMMICSERMGALLDFEECEVDKTKAMDFFATKYIHFAVKINELHGKERAECIRAVKKDLYLLSFAKKREDYLFFAFSKIFGVNVAIILFHNAVRFRNIMKNVLIK